MGAAAGAAGSLRHGHRPSWAWRSCPLRPCRPHPRRFGGSPWSPFRLWKTSDGHAPSRRSPGFSRSSAPAARTSRAWERCRRLPRAPRLSRRECAVNSGLAPRPSCVDLRTHALNAHLRLDVRSRLARRSTLAQDLTLACCSTLAAGLHALICAHMRWYARLRLEARPGLARRSTLAQGPTLACRSTLAAGLHALICAHMRRARRSPAARRSLRAHMR